MVTDAISPISERRRFNLYRLEIRRAADDLSGMAAGPFKQHVEGAADAAAIERRLLAIDRMLAVGAGDPI